MLSEEFEQGEIEILAAVIEAEFGLFEVKVERMGRNPLELGQPVFGVSPEALDTVDVRLAMDKLISSMMDSQMLSIAEIDQPVIAPPAVRMNDGV